MAHVLPAGTMAGALALVSSVAWAFEPSTSVGAADVSEPVVARLQWSRAPGAESCIDEGALTRAAESMLERLAFNKARPADVLVLGEVAPGRQGARWVARLLMQDRAGVVVGERELVTEAQACAALDGPLALALSLMVDIERPRIRILIPPPSRLPPLRLGVAASGVLAVGFLPGLAPGVRAAGLLGRPGQPRVSAEITAWPERRAQAATGAAGAVFRALQFGLGGCVGLAVLAASACAALQAAILDARGFGFAADDGARRFVMDASGRIQAPLWRKGRFQVHAGIEIAATIVGGRFYYVGEDHTEAEIHEISPLHAALSLGVAIVP